MSDTLSSVSDLAPLKSEQPLSVHEELVSPTPSDTVPQEMQRHPTLPPIRSAEDSDKDDLERHEPRSRPPRILAFRRETDPSSPNLLHSKDKSGSEPISARESMSRTDGYGEEMDFISVPTQTEWSWLEDRANSGLPPTGRSGVTPAGRRPSFVMRRPSESSHQSFAGLSRGSSRHGSSGLEGEMEQEEVEEELIEYPEEIYDDTYGVPLLDMSSESELSTEEDETTEEAQRRRAEREERRKKKQAARERAKKLHTLPSVGPPQILQYQRESEQEPLTTLDPEARRKRLQLLKDGVQEATESGTLSISLADLTSSSGGLRDSVQDKLDLGEWNWNRIATRQRVPTHADSGRGTDLSDDEWKELMNEAGVFEGICEFCSQPVKPFPTLEEQESEAPENLYCCEEYKDFVAFSVNHAAEAQRKLAAKPVDIAPHPPYGSKQARRAAKERAVQRMRERELKRQQEAAAGLQASFYQGTGGHSQAAKGGEPKDAVAFSAAAVKTMRTINYSLSSLKCLEEGWTLRPPTPLAEDDDSPDIFLTEPMLPASFVEEPERLQERPLIEKFYEDGVKFLTLFPDGSGNVFYHSGNLAIQIGSAALGQYSYTVFDDEQGLQLLGFFLPSGLGGCYYRSQGNLRLHLDQFGGQELDIRGGRKRKWSWTDHTTHVHAPPFQPVCFALNRNIGMRVMAQDNLALTFSCGRRSCRFNVGTKLKLIAPELIPEEEDETDKLYLNDSRNHVDLLLHKVGVLLKFPKCPKLESLKPPQYLRSRINRQKRAHFGSQPITTSRDSHTSSRNMRSSQPATRASQPAVKCS